MPPLPIPPPLLVREFSGELLTLSFVLTLPGGTKDREGGVVGDGGDTIEDGGGGGDILPIGGGDNPGEELDGGGGSDGTGTTGELGVGNKGGGGDGEF